MHPGVGAVHDVDEPPLINLHVVGLNDEVADRLGRLPRGDRDIRAPHVGVRRSRGNVVARLLRVKRLPDIDRPYARVEPRHEDQLPVEKLCKRLAAGVGAEATASIAEVTALLENIEVGDDGR